MCEIIISSLCVRLCLRLWLWNKIWCVVLLRERGSVPVFFGWVYYSRKNTGININTCIGIMVSVSRCVLWMGLCGFKWIDTLNYVKPSRCPSSAWYAVRNAERAKRHREREFQFYSLFALRFSRLMQCAMCVWLNLLLFFSTGYEVICVCIIFAAGSFPLDIRWIDNDIIFQNHRQHHRVGKPHCYTIETYCKHHHFSGC